MSPVSCGRLKPIWGFQFVTRNPSFTQGTGLSCHPRSSRKCCSTVGAAFSGFTRKLLGASRLQQRSRRRSSRGRGSASPARERRKERGAKGAWRRRWSWQLRTRRSSRWKEASHLNRRKGAAHWKRDGLCNLPIHLVVNRAPSASE